MFAAQVLGNMGEHAASAVPQLIIALSDDDEYVQTSAVQALGVLGEHAATHSLSLASAVNDLKGIDSDELFTLSAIGRTPPDQRIPIVQRCIDIANRRESVRGVAIFLSYLHSVGDNQIIRAIRWLEGSQANPKLAVSSAKEATGVLNALLPIWTESTKDKNNSPQLRLLMKSRMEAVLKMADRKSLWTARELGLLNTVNTALADDPSDTLTQLIARLEQGDQFRFYAKRVGLSVLGHLLFWVLLWFGYPRSKPIQALFFWNKWVRRFVGLGYVGLLLTWVPALRRRLLKPKPFAAALIDEAKLDRKSSDVYFGDSLVHCERTDEKGPVTKMIERLDGKILLEGDSGFGKTQFVKHLLRQSAARGRVSVYLPARLCDQGVFEAVKSKLLGFAKDDTFLKSILYAGGLDVYVDGLNEVNIDTRHQIIEFARSPRVSNLMIVTQPMDWEPPGALKIYHLQPLTPDQLIDFAQSQWPVLKDEAKIDNNEFITQCETLLRRAASLSGESGTSEQNATKHSQLDDRDYRVLSNPMDLTIATQIIAKGNRPNVQGLYAQQFADMAADYKERQKTDFPLTLFKERAFEMRLNDESALNTDGIPVPAFNRLEAHHLILRRVSAADSGSTSPSSPNEAWVFRHDKVWDYFIAKAFSGDTERQNQYMGDARFRGTYLMLIQEESLAAARDLEKRLSDYAAKTKDHSVNDDVRKLLMDREQHENAQSKIDDKQEKEKDVV